MDNIENPYYKPALQKLRNSDTGRTLELLAQATAANFLFDLESGDKNSEAAKALTPNQIYTAVDTEQSLKFVHEGIIYELQPYYGEMDEDTALEVLFDVRSSISESLLEAHLLDRGITPTLEQLPNRSPSPGMR